MSDLNPTPTWKRPPQTLGAALKRLDILNEHIYWLNDEARSAHLSWERDPENGIGLPASSGGKR